MEWAGNHWLEIVLVVLVLRNWWGIHCLAEGLDNLTNGAKSEFEMTRNEIRTLRRST